MAGDHHSGNHSTRSEGLGYHLRKNSSITQYGKGKAKKGGMKERKNSIYLLLGCNLAVFKIQHF